MVKYVCIEPGSGAYAATLTRRFEKKGVKSGWYSWYVNESDVPKDIEAKLKDRVIVVRVDGRSTLKSLKRALENPLDNRYRGSR